jgi:hypothetical protein
MSVEGAELLRDLREHPADVLHAADVGLDKEADAPTDAP